MLIVYVVVKEYLSLPLHAITVVPLPVKSLHRWYLWYSVW